MTNALIIDLREALRDFVAGIGSTPPIPDHVLKIVVYFVFDVLIFELEDHHEEPPLEQLDDFYRQYIEYDNDYRQRFLESFFSLVKSIATQIRSHGFSTENGFEFYPIENRNNQSVIVKRFGS